MNAIVLCRPSLPGIDTCPAITVIGKNFKRLSKNSVVFTPCDSVVKNKQLNHRVSPSYPQSFTEKTIVIFTFWTPSSFPSFSELPVIPRPECPPVGR